MSTEEIFVGRKKELQQFYDFLKNRQCSALMVVGERGIGKTTFLKEIRDRLEEDKDRYVVGFCEVPFYSKETTPFVNVLEDLMTKLNLSLKTQVKDGVKRAKKVFLKIVKEKGWKVAKSIVKEYASKLIGKEAVDEIEKAMTEGIEEWMKMPGVFMTAEDIISKYKDMFVPDLMFFFNSLVEEFGELEFVLVFDQFERALLPACHVLLDFIRLKPDRVRVVVALKVEEGGAERIRCFEPYLESMNIERLELTPLSKEDIAEWMKKIGKEFDYGELQKIRKFSGGIPFVISAWIKSPKGADLSELEGKAKDYCKFIKWRLEDLDKECVGCAKKLSVLLQPLSVAEYEELLGYCKPHLDKLRDVWIFSNWDSTFWFRHELVKSCIENMLGPKEKEEYHLIAARFFEETFKEDNKAHRKIPLEVGLGCAYHFHNAKDYEKSLTYNLSLGQFGLNRGIWDIAGKSFQTAIDDAENLNDENHKMGATGGLAWVYKSLERPDVATRLYTKILDYSRKNKNPKEESYTLHRLAMIEQDNWNYDEATKLYKQSLEIKEKIGDEKQISPTLFQLGRIEQDKGNYEKAVELYERSLRIDKKFKDRRGISYSLHQIANVCQIQGNYKKAIRLHNEGLRIDVALEDYSSMSKSFRQLGRVWQNQGNYEKATKLFHQSLEIDKKLGDQRGISATLHQLAMIEQDKRNYENATRLYEQSLIIANKLRDQKAAASTLGQLGRVHEEQGKLDKSTEYYANALTIFKRIGDKPHASLAKQDLDRVKQAATKTS